MSKITIAVLAGGDSSEAEISFNSGEQVMNTLDREKITPYLVYIQNNKWSVQLKGEQIPIERSDFSFLLNGTKISFDAIFMAIHGTPGEDGKLQSYFEMTGIPVTTCNMFVSALTFNKYACKMFLKDHPVHMAKSMLVRRGASIEVHSVIDKLGLPVFVKPNNGGSSFGVTKVKHMGDLKPAIEKALQHDYEVILEEFLEGTEVTCGAANLCGRVITFPPTEIVTKNEYFDYEAKYKGKSEEITPARIGDPLIKKCQQISEQIYNLLGCSGVVRIDYILRNNRFYFLEVNTVPGMSSESIIPQQVRKAGMDLKDFYTLLIEDAIARNKR